MITLTNKPTSMLDLPVMNSNFTFPNDFLSHTKFPKITHYEGVPPNINIYTITIYTFACPDKPSDPKQRSLILIIFKTFLFNSQLNKTTIQTQKITIVPKSKPCMIQKHPSFHQVLNIQLPPSKALNPSSITTMVPIPTKY